MTISPLYRRFLAGIAWRFLILVLVLEGVVHASYLHKCSNALLPSGASQIDQEISDELILASRDSRDISQLPFSRYQVQLLQSRTAELLSIVEMQNGEPVGTTRALKKILRALNGPFTYPQFMELAADFVDASYIVEVGPLRSMKQDQYILDFRTEIRDLNLKLRGMGLEQHILPFPLAQELSEEQISTLVSRGILPIGLLLVREAIIDGVSMNIANGSTHDFLHADYFIGEHGMGIQPLADKLGISPLEIFKLTARNVRSIQQRINLVEDRVFRSQLQWLLTYAYHDFQDLEFFYNGAEFSGANMKPESIATTFSTRAKREFVEEVAKHGRTWDQILAALEHIGRSIVNSKLEGQGSR